jgi:very-short-patch-repair endonuclease
MDLLQKYWPIVLAIIILYALKQTIDSRTKEFSGSYSKKSSLITQAEKDFFQVLRVAVGDKYEIFPQVNLDKFLLASGQYKKRDFHRMNQYSVDFIVCEKVSLTPLLAIELNDSSHYQSSRIERDQKVASILESATMPLLTIPWQSSYDPVMIASQINERI